MLANMTTVFTYKNHDVSVSMNECWIKLINKIVINEVISYLAQLQVLGLLYWPSASPRANTANLGPVTGPIRNYLINNIIILFCTDM